LQVKIKNFRGVTDEKGIYLFYFKEKSLFVIVYNSFISYGGIY